MYSSSIIHHFGQFFPGAFKEGSAFLNNPDGKQIFDRLLKVGSEPLHLTNFNQLLHLVHEAGVSDGFFRYYFQSMPDSHPYPLKSMQVPVPPLDKRGISSMEQAEWGFLRFFTDALLFWGDIRSAYRELRGMTYDELETFFGSKRFPSDKMRGRGKILPMHKIPMDDRYLISEIACKAYSFESNPDQLHIEEVLLDAYRSAGSGRIKIKTLFDKESQIAKDAPDKQMMLELAAEEFMEDEVGNEDEIKAKITSIAKRFVVARDAAYQNTRLYLSFVNELDIYVATSMRRRDDFRNMARDCEHIFRQRALLSG